MTNLVFILIRMYKNANKELIQIEAFKNVFNFK